MSKIEEIRVGLNSCGIAAGGNEVYNALKEETKKRKLSIRLKSVGCIGMCYSEPLVDVIQDGKAVTYGMVKPKLVADIIEAHLGKREKKETVEKFIVKGDDIRTKEDSFFDKQVKIVLRNCGIIDPDDIDEYISRDGYKAIEKVIGELTQEKVIEMIQESGLRGRGGAGFPTGIKWDLARASKDGKKFIVCNGDEGDPGAFMDRSTLEGDPHSVIEGMLIGAFAIGACEGYIYVRAEYPLAVKRLRNAIKKSKKYGFLGKNILGTKFSFDINIIEGAGAFVCGEETALMASIEGKRGMPRTRPPYPAVSGLWGYPTNINNVETWANIPFIILHGPSSFNQYGKDRSKGTKVFSLAGKIVRGGLVEVPMGITLREVIFDVGGGILGDKKFKAAQLGGPSGGCIPESLIDTPVDYESITKTGAIMGSGGMVVMDEETCMVDVARFFLSFTQDESCGKCTFCRVGSKRMLEILTRITEGKGKEGDIETLEKLSQEIKSGSLCGLGQTAPNPVLTTIRYFRDEYEEHIKNKKCPAHKCRSLITYSIDSDKCTGCGRCKIVCPVGAVTGEPKKMHTIDSEKCSRCGFCRDACNFDAIKVE
ncbi:NADH-quinone oxidoreductase subunit NuoF [candidate division WOR-3 bacterium]|nr:NADH-quinone oxidoreductase subunit NuoF [candidate division WOR-3 bacterium]